MSFSAVASTAGLPVRWGIIGAGGAAKDFVKGAAGSPTGHVAAIGTRKTDVSELRAAFPHVRIAGDYETLLRDPSIDAVYIATPHPFHAQWAIAAAGFGKHVLCEKPMGVSAREVESMFVAASRAGTFLGEAFMYRLHPLVRRILDLLKGGTVGDLRLIKASFGFAVPPSVGMQHRLFSPTLGGGAILDTGCYVMSMARLLAGYRNPSGLAEPSEVHSVTSFATTGVDEMSTALVSFPDGIIAQLSCSIVAWQDNVLHVIGTKARLEIDQFWFAGGKRGGSASIRICANGVDPQEVFVDECRDLYSFQFEAANQAIRSGVGEFSFPGSTAFDSIGNATALDRWRRQPHGA